MPFLKKLFLLLVFIVAIKLYHLWYYIFTSKHKSILKSTTFGSNKNTYCQYLNNISYNDTIARFFMINETQKRDECIEIEDLVRIIENNYEYVFQLNPKLLADHFNKDENSFKCKLETFDRNYNVIEGDEKEVTIRAMEYFQRRFNYTIVFKKYGFIYLSCFMLFNNSEVLIYDETFNIFPKNMSKLFEDKNSYYSQIEVDFQKMKFLDKESKNNLNKKMNVLMIYIDSVSYQHLKRAMPITYDYLTNKLENNYVYSSMVTVGEKSYANALPLLSGIVVEEDKSINLYADENYYNSKYDGYFHRYPFIWYEYEKNGYITGFQVCFKDFMRKKLKKSENRIGRYS